MIRARGPGENPLGQCDVMIKLIVTQTVVGDVPVLRKHFLLGEIRSALARGSLPDTYTIELAEVIGVKEV